MASRFEDHLGLHGATISYRPGLFAHAFHTDRATPLRAVGLYSRQTAVVGG